jgi:hypothetical protein
VNTVHLLLKADGRVVSVYESQVAAEAKRDQYNADPFMAPAVADTDAPYSVETWSVSDGVSPARVAS